ncbi:MAG TPA: SpoIIE family protein phosphatase [Bacteroidales bacterium]|nr:SpoIIE family protein phosphatase [Bacteroidales bacterium]
MAGKFSIKRIRFRGLAFRYGMFFLVSILVVFVISFYYTFNNSRKLLLEQAEKNAENLTSLTVARIENILQPVEQIPLGFARNLALPATNYQDIREQMKDFIMDNEVVYGSILAFEPYAYNKKLRFYAPYYYYDRDLGLMEKVQTGADYDYFTYDWYALPKAAGKPVWTEPYFDKGGGNVMMCTYSVPFYRNENGKRVFKGVVTMDISLFSLDSIVSSVHLFKSGFGFLISKAGKVITYPDRQLVNEDFYQFVRQNEKLRLIGRKMMNGESGFENLTGLTRNKNERNWIYYAPVPSTGWSLGVIIPENELYAGLIGFFYRLFGVFLLGIFAIFLITILLTRKFMKPISQLAKATHEIGKGNFNAPLPVYRSRDEISQLSNSFLLMQEELNNYLRNLKEAVSAREKIESELTVARDIQMGMLPVSFPDRNDCELFALLKSAREVGGDLYDFFFPAHDRLFMAVGDVSGKGVPASLFMAITRTLFRARMTDGASLCTVMEGINRELVKENPNQIFVTFLAAILDLNLGTLEICNAGHNSPMILRRNGSIERLANSGNIPLGVRETATYPCQQADLRPGDTVLCYTDGITEACNPKEELYREKRILDFLSGCGERSPRQIAESLLQDVRKFEEGNEQSDDITLLALKYKGRQGEAGPGEDAREIVLQNRAEEMEILADTLEELAEKWSLDPRTAMETHLILEELVSNIIFYAYEDPGMHSIRIRLEKQGDHLVLTVTDDGKPFNLMEIPDDADYREPAENRKVGGLGIHFIKTLAGKIEYSRTGDRNIVKVIKNIHSKPD